MRQSIIALSFVLVAFVFISGCVQQSLEQEFPREEKKQTEISIKGQKDLKVIISPSVDNSLSGEVTIRATAVPAETGAVAFALVPSGEQFAMHHVLWWDRNGADGWSYGFDTSNFDNGAYSLMVMAVKQMGEQPLEIASAEAAIRNEETGFVSPPTTRITRQKSLALSEYIASTSDVRKAKELGANMVTLAFNLDITKDNEVKIPTDPTENFQILKKKLSNLINEAHKQGLQVELRTTMVLESAGATDTEKLLVNMLPFIREWTKFAEEQKIYSFTTFGEVDDDKHSKDLNKLNKAVLAEVRKGYNGKVGVGFCCTYSEAVNPSPQLHDVSGYDYIIISIYPGSGSDALRRYYNMLVPAISGARNMAKKYGVNKVYIGEVGVLNPSDNIPLSFTAVVDQEQEAEFYDKLFTTTSDIIDGYTIPYAHVGTIKDQPAEKVVSEWYNKLS